MLTAAVVCGGLLAAMAANLGDAQQPPTIRMDVNLVQLHVRVTDRQGHPVSGLAKDAFQLFVDDIPTPITVFQGEDAPVTAGIVVDNSASMAPKEREVIAAALAFARASNSKDQMFVVHFSTHARLGLPEGTPFTGNVSELEKAISAFDLGGTTAFYDAVLMAERHLQGATYPKVLLTISDGGDNSSQATLDDVLAAAAGSETAIYTIGLFTENDRDRNPTVLEKLARNTGGQAYFPAQVADVTATCIRIAQSIREQYTLGFPGAEDGQFHRVRLAVADPKLGPLQAHTRPGYIAARRGSANRSVRN